jgi:hypothetical protein
VRRIRIQQASFAAALSVVLIAATTASASAPKLFLTSAGVRVGKGQPATIRVSPLNLEVGESTAVSCSQIIRDGEVSVTGKPTAKLAFPGEEIETECLSGAGLSGFIRGVDLARVGSDEGRITLLSKGGIMMEAPVGTRRCAYGASTLTGGFYIGLELASVQVFATAKLNTKYSSPGCPTSAELEGYVTLNPNGGPAFETEA